VWGPKTDGACRARDELFTPGRNCTAAEDTGLHVARRTTWQGAPSLRLQWRTQIFSILDI